MRKSSIWILELFLSTTSTTTTTPNTCFSIHTETQPWVEDRKHSLFLYCYFIELRKDRVDFLNRFEIQSIGIGDDIGRYGDLVILGLVDHSKATIANDELFYDRSVKSPHPIFAKIYIYIQPSTSQTFTNIFCRIERSTKSA